MPRKAAIENLAIKRGTNESLYTKKSRARNGEYRQATITIPERSDLSVLFERTSDLYAAYCWLSILSMLDIPLNIDVLLRRLKRLFPSESGESDQSLINQ